MIATLEYPAIQLPRDAKLLSTITYHIFIDMKRHNQRYSDEDINSEIARPQLQNLNSEERDQIDEAVIAEIYDRVLSSDEERMIFQALVEEGLTFKEIAERGHISIANVRTVKRNIHRKLLRYLAKSTNRGI